MPLPKTGIKFKPSQGRGAGDFGLVLEAITEDWGSLQDALNGLSANDKTAICEHFNGLNEDYDTLGDMLFGELEDFKQVVENMNPEEQKKLVEELIEAEIIDKDSFST